MPLKLQCLKCHKALTVPDQLAGRTGKCPGCGASVSIPPLPPPPPASPVVIPNVVVEPLVATVVHDAPPPPPPPTASRFAGLRNRTWQFWATTAAGVIAGLYFVSLLWGMGVAAWAEAKRISSSDTPGTSVASVETALSRLGYRTHECLVCRRPRSATSRSVYSDDYGYGLCEECGPGHQAMMRVGQNGGTGSYADQQAAQQFVQAMQHHMGPDPSEAQRTVVIGLMSFDSPEWNSLFGPVK